MLNNLFKNVFTQEEMSNRVASQPAAVQPRTFSAPRVIVNGESAERGSPVEEKCTSRDDSERVTRAQLNAAAWEARLHSSLQFLEDEAADLPESPDAALLLEELGAPSDFMIRQLPAAAREALELCENPDVSRSQLADQLGQDPSLMQAILRSANSAAASGGGKPIMRIESALDRVGLRAARSIVLANCVDGLLSRPGQPYEPMVAGIWSHMIRTGNMAKVTARCFNADPDETFTIALLHDVGKLVVFDQITALRSKLRRPVAVPLPFLHTLVQEVHESLGALAAFRWEMGADAANAIGTHARSDSCAADNPMADAVYTAERVDNIRRRGEMLDIEHIWITGRLSGSHEAAAQIIGDYCMAA